MMSNGGVGHDKLFGFEVNPADEVEGVAAVRDEFAFLKRVAKNGTVADFENQVKGIKPLLSSFIHTEEEQHRFIQEILDAREDQAF